MPRRLQGSKMSEAEAQEGYPVRIDTKLNNTDGSRINYSSTIGIDNKRIPELVKTYDKSESETIIEGANNAIIVLGRDRPGNISSGKGGAGEIRCGTIQLITGRPTGYGYSNPNIIDNSSTIYISQRTDIDKNMGLSEGEVGISSDEAAIGLRSTSVRISARKGIKIVSGMNEDPDRQGPVQPEDIIGIDLNAGNQDGSITVPGYGEVKALQPIPRGDNLVSVLNVIVERIDELGAAVEKLIDNQGKLDNAIKNHTHQVVGPFPGLATPSIDLLAALPAIKALITGQPLQEVTINRQNLSNDTKNYLEKDGPLNINSKNNKTT